MADRRAVRVAVAGHRVLAIWKPASGKTLVRGKVAHVTPAPEVPVRAEIVRATADLGATVASGLGMMAGLDATAGRGVMAGSDVTAGRGATVGSGVTAGRGAMAGSGATARPSGPGPAAREARTKMAVTRVAQSASGALAGKAPDRRRRTGRRLAGPKVALGRSARAMATACAPPERRSVPCVLPFRRP